MRVEEISVATGPFLMRSDGVRMIYEAEEVVAAVSFANRSHAQAREPEICCPLVRNIHIHMNDQHHMHNQPQTLFVRM